MQLICKYNRGFILNNRFNKLFFLMEKINQLNAVI